MRFFKKVFYLFFDQISCKCESLYYRFIYSKPGINALFAPKRYLLCAGESPDDIAKDYNKLFQDKVEPKITQADLICEHIFDLLGSNPKRLSPDGEGYQPVDWHSDFKGNFRWDPKTFYRDIEFGNVKGADVKIPWELSRFQHLNILGQAYVITKDEKYATEFENQIRDWIENNPAGFGVNWRCTMDIAIRAVNWLVAMEYFTEEGVLSGGFLKVFYTSVYEHGRFIRRHLESKSYFLTNHYIANIAGLFFISVYCPFFRESKKWRNFAIKELSRQLERQVYSDGCDYEASTSYHRLALEMFFYSELLAKRAGIEFPEIYRDRLRKMFECSLYCIKPDGRVPQIGDNDSGRFLLFCKRPVLNHVYLLILCSIHFKDPGFKLPSFDFDEEAFWVFGKNGVKVYENLASRKGPVASRTFPDAGWYIMRHNDNYCFISCGPNGQGGNGGHAHNDKLGFELVINGQDIIVDPGSYLYTPDPVERNKFRSSGYHNIIKFNTLEQNEIPGKNLFALTDRVKIEDAVLDEIDKHIHFTGEIRYSGVIHKREITFVKGSGHWRIADMISSSRPLDGKLIFHLSPDLTYENSDILVKKTKKRVASIVVDEYNLERGRYDYSAEYGVKSEAECLTVNIYNIRTTRSINTHIRMAK